MCLRVNMSVTECDSLVLVTNMRIIRLRVHVSGGKIQIWIWIYIRI